MVLGLLEYAMSTVEVRYHIMIYYVHIEQYYICYYVKKNIIFISMTFVIVDLMKSI